PGGRKDIVAPDSVILYLDRIVEARRASRFRPLGVCVLSCACKPQPQARNFPRSSSVRNTRCLQDLSVPRPLCLFSFAKKSLVSERSYFSLPRDSRSWGHAGQGNKKGRKG